jgi:hypothetical protein
VEEHGVTFRQYRAQHPDLEVTSHWLPCRLCDAKVKFTREAVAAHLRTSHGLDIPTYEEHYMEDRDWPDSLDHSASASRSQSFDSESLPGELVIAELEPEPDSPNPGRDTVWNRCQFECALCQAVFTDRRNMKSHALATHGLAYTEYVARHGDPEVPTPKWVCAVCGSETRHARNNIYIHLRDCHGLTCDQYAAQHGFPGSGAEVVRPVGEGGNMRDATQFSSKWNKCRFVCHVCNKVANEKRHIRSHTLQAHATSLDLLEAEHGDCEVHTEYFFCAVCHAEVKHCHRNILMHLQRSHGMNTQVGSDGYSAPRHTATRRITRRSSARWTLVARAGGRRTPGSGGTSSAPTPRGRCSPRPVPQVRGARCAETSLVRSPSAQARRGRGAWGRTAGPSPPPAGWSAAPAIYPATTAAACSPA